MIGTTSNRNLFIPSSRNLFILRYYVFVALCHLVSGEPEGECLLQQQIKQGRVQSVHDLRHLTSEVAENFCQKGILLKKDDWEESVCCDSTCGSCGGPDCAESVGGREKCCGGEIRRSGKVCASPDDVACVVKPLPDQEQSESFKVDDYVLVKEGSDEWTGIVTSVDPLKVDGKLVNKVPDSDLIILPIKKAPKHFKICHGNHALSQGGSSGDETADCFRKCDEDPKCTHFTIFERSNGCRTFSGCSETGVTGDGFEGPRTFAMTRAPVQSPDMTQVIGQTARYRCDGKPAGPSENWGNLGEGKSENYMSSVECRQACMGSTSCKFVVYRMPTGTCTQVDACDTLKKVGDGPFNNWKKEAPSPTDAPPVPVVRPTAAPTSPTDEPVVSSTGAPVRPTGTPVTRPTAAPPSPQKPPVRRRRPKPRSSRRRRIAIPDIVRQLKKQNSQLKKQNKQMGSLQNRVKSLEADSSAK